MLEILSNNYQQLPTIILIRLARARWRIKIFIRSFFFVIFSLHFYFISILSGRIFASLFVGEFFVGQFIVVEYDRPLRFSRRANYFFDQDLRECAAPSSYARSRFRAIPTSISQYPCFITGCIAHSSREAGLNCYARRRLRSDNCYIFNRDDNVS